MNEPGSCVGNARNWMLATVAEALYCDWRAISAVACRG